MSTMTGGVYPCLIFGHENINMTIIDNTRLMEEHGGDPSFYDDCINFSKVKFDFIKHIPTTEEITKLFPIQEMYWTKVPKLQCLNESLHMATGYIYRC